MGELTPRDARTRVLASILRRAFRRRLGGSGPLLSESLLATLGTDVRFKAKLFRYPGPGGWTFARVPAKHAPPTTQPWGRTPVLATVNGQSWKTSVWRDKKHGTLLPVPKRIRGELGDGDAVTIELSIRPG